MITNERQYRITKAELRKFEKALAAQEDRDPSPDVDPQVHAAMGDALESEVLELRRQLHEYEKLREGEVTSRTVHSLQDLPRVLIEARIAARTTQKALANRIGVAEQQIQRWEATGYAGVAIDRIQTVVDALGAAITKKVSFSVPPTASERKRRRKTAASRAPAKKAATASTGRAKARAAGGARRAAKKTGAVAPRRSRRSTSRGA
jgi:transcriptional regulator with XRE-family HTH domain